MTAAEALDNRDRVLDEVVAKLAARGSLTPGMEVFARWARSGREFGLNDIRGELKDAGVDVSKGMGGITMRALRAGLIHKVRDVTSTSQTTNGKTIGLYRGGPNAAAAEVLAVPVVRNRRGRFTNTPSAPVPDALFDIPLGGTA